MKIFIPIIFFTFAAFSSNKLLSEDIPYPFYTVQKTEEGFSNELTVLNSGIVSLQSRLDIIRKAKTNIEVEYFIYSLDQSSKILTTELVEAAKRNVKVRILVDKSAAVFKLDEYYAKALKEVGIEVKYYNTAPIIRLSTVNFRNHRKLISVDDEYAIVGGRNIGDDYFDFSTEYNFLDRDVLIEGDIVKTIRESFDLYFNDKISKNPVFPKRPSLEDIKKRGNEEFQKSSRQSLLSRMARYDKKLKEAREFLERSSEDQTAIEKVEQIASPILEQKISHSCPELTYSTDAPGADFFARIKSDFEQKHRFLRKTLFDKISKTNRRVILSSPYMINNKDSRILMESLIQKGIDIDLYTNSLASTDAVYVAANLYKDVFKWGKKGIETFIHDGKFISETPTLHAGIEKATWGTHSKTQVYESINEEGGIESEVMIGTYNIDNRSNFYNSEMAIFCKGNRDLTQEVKDNILSRINKGTKILPNNTAMDRKGNKKSIYGSSKKGLGLMKIITIPSRLLKFLL